MKTTSQNQKSERQNRADQQLSTSTGTRAKINYKKRFENRALSTENLLALLKAETPKFFELAEVVGKWVWIHFTDKQPSAVTRDLAELGFSWHSASQSWHHPCGAFLPRRIAFDPRKNNGSYHSVA